jgi:hypothetical protein
MHATHKGLHATTFKLKQFLLYVVVPTAQLEDYKLWLNIAKEVCIFQLYDAGTYLPKNLYPQE